MNAKREGLALPESNEFAGKRVLITGGSSGIGLATVQSFVEKGSHVGVIDIGQRPNFLPEIDFQNVDVGDWNAVETCVNAFVKQFRGLDIVVNNAAIKVGGNILEVTNEDFERLLRVNGLGFWHVAKSALRGQAGPQVLKPEDIAQMILSLASKKNTKFNGTIYSLRLGHKSQDYCLSERK